VGEQSHREFYKIIRWPFRGFFSLGGIYMKEFSNFSQIINGKYLESDILELILRENGHLENITQEIVELTISHLEPYLKKNFESKKYEILRQILGNSEENYNLIEKLLAPIENVLVNMDRNYGSLEDR
jgi:hypothetical protein